MFLSKIDIVKIAVVYYNIIMIKVRVLLNEKSDY